MAREDAASQATINPTLQYDSDGNQTVGTGGLQMSWNANAQAVAINGVGAVYDAAGRLVEIGDQVNAVSAAKSAGSITLGGGSPGEPTGTPTYNGTATVTIAGAEQNKTITSSTGSQATGCGEIYYNSPGNYTCYDSGGGELMIMGMNSSGSTVLGSYSVGYGDSTATPGSLAQELANTINEDWPSGIYAIPSTTTPGQLTVYIAEAAAYNMYGVTAPSTPNGLTCEGAFSPCSFTLSAPGGTPVGAPACVVHHICVGVRALSACRRAKRANWRVSL